jgi:hypothetical protein
MIKLGSVWKRVGRKWEREWVEQMLVVVYVTGTDITYRYPRNDSTGHVESTVEKSEFDIHFEHLKDP